MQFYFYTFLLLFFSAGAFADTNALAVPDSLQQQTDSLTKDTAKITDTTAATIPLCLWDWEKQLHKGDKIVLAAFGGGFTWGATLLKWAYDTK